MSILSLALAVTAGAEVALFDSPTGTSLENRLLGSLDFTHTDAEMSTEAGVGDVYWYAAETNDVATVEAYAEGDAYEYSPENPRAAMFAYEPESEPGANRRFLAISATDGNEVERSILPRTVGMTNWTEVTYLKARIGAGIWADTLVSFTATTNAPPVYEDDKIVVWLSDTNLMVTAGYLVGGYNRIERRDYVITNAVNGFQWYRLTIRTMEDVTDGAGVQGFALYLDGKPVVADANYAIYDSREALGRTGRLTAQSKMLIAERRLFPGLGAPGADPSHELSRLAFDGSGSVDDVSFSRTPQPFAGDETVFTLRWDAGVKSFDYTLDGAVTNRINASALAEREMNFAVPSGQVTRVTFTSVAYDTTLEYKEGLWTGENGVTTNVTVIGGVTNRCFVIPAGGHINPIGNIASKRDYVLIGEGSYGSFSEAKKEAKRQGVKTLALASDVLIGQKDRYYAAFNSSDDFILDLCGHALMGTNAQYATVHNYEGRLEIIDSVGGGRILCYNMLPGLAETNLTSAAANYAVYAGGRRAKASLSLRAGAYDGEVFVETNVTALAPSVAIEGGSYRDDDDTSFYLAQYVTNSLLHFAYVEPYWEISTSYAISYDPAGGTMPEGEYITRYTALTPPTPLPVPTYANHRFLGWWCEAEERYFSNVSELTPNPRSVALVAKWDTWPISHAKIWTGGGAPDTSWTNAANWSVEGVPAAGDLALFPTNDRPWQVDLGAGWLSTTNLYLYCDVILAGSNDWSEVKLRGTGRLSGDATLTYVGVPPTNLLKGRFDDGWRGTVLVADIPSEVELGELTGWGSANSKVVFRKVNGYVNHRVATLAPYELVLEAADQVTPAWLTSKGFTGNTLSFAKLSGDGQLAIASDRKSCLQVFRFASVADYTGVLDVSGRRVVLGAGYPADDKPGTITFSDGVTFRSGLYWSCSNAVFRGTMRVIGSSGDRILSYAGTADVTALAGVTLVTGAEEKPAQLVVDGDAKTVSVMAVPTVSAFRAFSAYRFVSASPLVFGDGAGGTGGGSDANASGGDAVAADALLPSDPEGSLAWSNAGVHTGDVQRVVSTNWTLRLTPTAEAPLGTVVRLHRLTLARTEADADKAAFFAVKDLSDGWIRTQPLLEEGTIATTNGGSAVALHYIFADDCRVTVGRTYEVRAFAGVDAPVEAAGQAVLAGGVPGAFVAEGSDEDAARALFTLVGVPTDEEEDVFLIDRDMTVSEINYLSGEATAAATWVAADGVTITWDALPAARAVRIDSVGSVALAGPWLSDAVDFTVDGTLTLADPAARLSFGLRSVFALGGAAGAGTFVFEPVEPPADVFTDDAFAGTVEIRRVTDGAFDFARWGGVRATLRLVAFAGAPVADGFAFPGTVELADEAGDALTVTGGADVTCAIGALAGTGTFRATGGASVFRFAAMSNFTGVVSIASEASFALGAGDVPAAGGVIFLGAGETVTLVAADRWQAPRGAAGSGTVLCDGFLPAAGLFDGADWAGTLRLSHQALEPMTLAGCGTAASRIVLSDIVATLPATAVSVASDIVLADAADGAAALTVTNGTDWALFDVRKLSGTGAFVSTSPAKHVVRVANSDDFAGDITISERGTILVLDSNVRTTFTSGAGGFIRIEDRVILPTGKTWDAVGGLDIRGEIVVTGTMPARPVILGDEAVLEFVSADLPLVASSVTCLGRAWIDARTLFLEGAEPPPLTTVVKCPSLTDVSSFTAVDLPAGWSLSASEGVGLTLVKTSLRVVWTGAAGDGLWDSPLNWDTQSVPAAGAVVTIDVTGSRTLTLPDYGTERLSALTLTGDGTLKLVGGTLHAGGFNLSAFTGTLLIPAGGFTVTGTPIGAVALAEGSGTLTVVLPDGARTKATFSLPAGATLDLCVAAGTATAAGEISGAGALRTSGAGVLVLAGENVFTGGATLGAAMTAAGVSGRGGSGAFGAADASWTPTVAVAAGAVLDVNGQTGTTYVVSLAADAALANTGLGQEAAAGLVRGLVLAGDAAALAVSDLTLADAAGARLVLNGHVLTASGAGAFRLTGATVTDAGTLRATEGLLVSDGSGFSAPSAAVVLAGEAAFDCPAPAEIATLTLENGNAVTGAGVLTVRTRVSAEAGGAVSNLALGANATVALGGRPLVLETLSRAGAVTLDVSAVADQTVPVELLRWPAATTDGFTLAGTSGKTLYVAAGALWMKPTGSVSALISIEGDPTAGLNFTSSVVTVRISDWDGSLAGKAASIVIRATDLAGNVVTQRVAVTGDGLKDVTLSGLDRGTEYLIEAALEVTGQAEVKASAEPERVVLANGAEWFREDAGTFAGERPGAGAWAYAAGAAKAEDGRIVIRASAEFSDGTPVRFTPTNAPSLYRSFETRLTASFDTTCDDLASIDATGLYGFTLSTDAALEPVFAVLDGDVWRIVPRTLYAPETGIEYTFAITVDERTDAIAYDLVLAGGARLRLASSAGHGKARRMRAVEFTGRGAVARTEADLYDVRLVRTDVTLSDASLVAGMNFTNTVLAGTVDVAKLHLTDADRGTITVTLRDYAGAAVASTNIAFAGTGSYDFSFFVGEVTPGAKYWSDVSVTLDEDPWDDRLSENGDTSRAALMANLVDAGWIRENARTFGGYLPATGEWAYEEGTASVRDKAIRIETRNGSRVDSRVVFTPTNRLASSSQGYSVRTSATFTRVSGGTVDATDAIAALTLVYEGVSDSALVFSVASNGVWTTVPSSVYAPKLGEVYEFDMTVDQKFRTLVYEVTGPDGEKVRLASVDLDGASVPRLSRLAFLGNGDILRIVGDGFETTLVDSDVTFGESALVGGVNFTNTVITGRVDLTELHLTDMTNGHIVVTLADYAGNVVGVTNIVFHGLGSHAFSALVEGVTAGGFYVADVKVVLDDDPAREKVSGDAEATKGNVMANVDGTGWIRECAATFAGDEPGTGEWTYVPGAAEVSGRDVVVKTEGGDGEEARVSFVPTNAISATRHGYGTSSTMIFSTAVTTLIDPSKFLSCVTVKWGDDNETNVVFAIVLNGAWVTVPESVFRPELGVAYTIGVVVDEKTRYLSYWVTTADGVTTRLGGCTLDPSRETLMTRAGYIGSGSFRSLDGDAFDTHLVKTEISFDESSLDGGVNYTNTLVTGRVDLTELHLTDMTNGLIVVRLVDADGNVVSVTTNAFAGLGAHEFSSFVDALSAGGRYTAEVEVILAGDTDGKLIGETEANQGAVMGGITTNGAWSVEGWIRENAASFAGLGPGTGTWVDTNGLARAEEGWIAFDTGAAEHEGASFSFVPTNATPDGVSYEIRLRTAFESAYDTVDAVPDVFGLAVSYFGDPEDGLYQLNVVTNGVWTAVPREVFSPVLGEPYVFTFDVDERAARISYYVTPTNALTRRLASGPLPDETFFDEVEILGTGALEWLSADRYNVRLLNVNVLGAGELGTNFEARAVGGRIELEELHATDKTNGTYVVTVRDAWGAVVTNVTFALNGSGAYWIDIGGLEQGSGYTVEVKVDVGTDADSVTGDSAKTDHEVQGLKTGEGWVRENAATFAGEEASTGSWIGTNGTSEVVADAKGRVIRMETVDAERIDFRVSPSRTPDWDVSTYREFRFSASFAYAGMESEIRATTPDDLTGVALAAGDDRVNRLFVYVKASATHPGTWHQVSEEVFAPEAGVEYDFTTTVDYDGRTIVHYVTTNGVAVRLGTWTFTSFDRDVDNGFGFVGSGALRKAEADYWDANLVRDDGGREYWTFSDAVAKAGAGAVLEPLWYQVYRPAGTEGEFRVRDPNAYLTIVWPLGYNWTRRVEGDIVVYWYGKSDNWLDYADAAGVERQDDVYVVSTPNGLAYLAQLTTNDWLRGSVALATNIDLAAHYWTPIARFEGTFDGRGYRVNRLQSRNKYAYRPAETNLFGGYSYALFGTATNSTFRNVTFTDVAIDTVTNEFSGVAVAALVAEAKGSLVVSNVTVASGRIAGLDSVAGVVGRAGEAVEGAPATAEILLAGVTNAATVVSSGAVSGARVAGVLGFASAYSTLTLLDNLNAGTVSNAALHADVDYYAAGLATVGAGAAYAPGAYRVVASNNVNRGRIFSTLYRIEARGGNVAQVLANASRDRSAFDSVSLGGNVGAGAVGATLHYNDDRLFDVFPILNFAPVAASYDDYGNYRVFVEANDPAATVLDPVRHTARMSMARYENDVANDAGSVYDDVTASASNATVEIIRNLYTWESVPVDRDLVIECNNRAMKAMFGNVLFWLADGVKLTLRNATLYAYGGVAFGGDTNNITLVNVTIRDIDTLADPTMLLNGEEIAPMALVAKAKTGSSIFIPLGSTITVEGNELLVDGEAVSAFRDYYDVFAEDQTDGSTRLSLTLNANALPSFAGLSLVKTPAVKTASSAEAKVVQAATAAVKSASVFDLGSRMTLEVRSTRTGLYYGLESAGAVATPDDAWTAPQGWYEGSEGATLELTAPAYEGAGFYRIRVTDHAPNE